MLQINKLTISHIYDNRALIKDFSCTFNSGDKVAIVGEEGNGKSTLLKWIYCPSLIGQYTEVHYESLKNNEKMGYLAQELSSDDNDKTVYEYFSIRDEFLEATTKELGKLAYEFHLPDDFYYSTQKVKTLSGGEKIKAQLMRILLTKPTLLLLDEPSNDLDIEKLEFLEEFIKKWEHIILFISHDEILIENTANVIVHFEQIKKKTEFRYTISSTNYQTYKQRRDDLFNKQRQMAISDKREKAKRDEKYRRVYESVNHALNTVSRQDPGTAKNLKDKMHSIKAMGKRFEKEDEAMTKMPEREESIYFSISDENASLPNGKTVLDLSLDELFSLDHSRILANNIHLHVSGPQKICIIGSNGCGKTTLLKLIASLLCDRKDLQVEYMSQNYEDELELDITPIEFLSNKGDKDEITKIRTTLGSLKFTKDEMTHAIKNLSGGQKAKIFLLKMSLHSPNVLLLDEPTRNFSPLSTEVIRQMLIDFPGAIISISHDRKYIQEVCDTIYRLTKNGLEKVDLE